MQDHSINKSLQELVIGDCNFIFFQLFTFCEKESKKPLVPGKFPVCIRQLRIIHFLSVQIFFIFINILYINIGLKNWSVVCAFVLLCIDNIYLLYSPSEQRPSLFSKTMYKFLNNKFIYQMNS